MVCGFIRPKHNVLVANLIFVTFETVSFCSFRKLGVAGTGPTTTTTTTIGPPIEAEISVMSEVLTNYTVDNFPSRDLSTPIGTKVDMFLVGINDLDEVLLHTNEIKISSCSNPTSFSASTSCGQHKRVRYILDHLTRISLSKAF